MVCGHSYVSANSFCMNQVVLTFQTIFFFSLPILENLGVVDVENRGRVGNVADLLESLPGMHRAPGSIPVPRHIHHVWWHSPKFP